VKSFSVPDLDSFIPDPDLDPAFYAKYQSGSCFGQTINKATAGIRFFTWQTEGRHYFGDHKVIFGYLITHIFVHYSIGIEKLTLP
jgi:hypothetical protein